jgi:CO dehydrogenase/acetyl-CoA synthase beta subunit
VAVSNHHLHLLPLLLWLPVVYLRVVVPRGPMPSCLTGIRPPLATEEVVEEEEGVMKTGTREEEPPVMCVMSETQEEEEEEEEEEVVVIVTPPEIQTVGLVQEVVMA